MMPSRDEEFAMSETLHARLGRLAVRMRESLRQATRLVLPSAAGAPRASVRPPANAVTSPKRPNPAIDGIAAINILEAAPLNGAAALFSASTSVSLQILNPEEIPPCCRSCRRIDMTDRRSFDARSICWKAW
jgi:hypothetical protein